MPSSLDDAKTTSVLLFDSGLRRATRMCRRKHQIALYSKIVGLLIARLEFRASDRIVKIDIIVLSPLEPPQE